jgi:hypothetical protein
MAAPPSKFGHARGACDAQVESGRNIMGIQTDQALAPLCDLGSRQLAAMGATILGIALASLMLFG